jgi:hypothetical protein
LLVGLVGLVGPGRLLAIGGLLALLVGLLALGGLLGALLVGLLGALLGALLVGLLVLLVGLLGALLVALGGHLAYFPYPLFYSMHSPIRSNQI